MFNAIFLDFYGTLVYEDDEIVTRITQEISLKSPDSPTNSEIAV